MSHTSQRRGLDPDRPGKELVVLAMVPTQYKDVPGIRDAMAELAATMLEHGPDNWISRNFTEIDIPQLGAAQHLVRALNRVSPTKVANLLMREVAEMSSVITAVYTDPGKVANLINDLKGDWLARNREKGYPISIVLSGLTDDVHGCCQKTGLTEHTYLHSLGFFGQVQDLPTEDELSLITMCGHGLIAVNRVRRLVQRIRDGETTPKEAANDIAKPCVCGIVNRQRAEEIFRRLATV
jgi:hypothetical protein